MKVKYIILLLNVFFIAVSCTSTPHEFLTYEEDTIQKLEDARWSEEDIWNWYDQQGTVIGCNFLPSTATNTTEMWAEETFDLETIEKELELAQSTGYNSVRVFLQYIVWKDNPKGFKARLSQFLQLAKKYGISTMPILFDDCAFGYPAKTEPYLGFQGDPKPGEYSPYWTPSPGHKTASSPENAQDLYEYVHDIVSSFKKDDRIICWDVYNEAGNAGAKNMTLPLLVSAFQWVRDCHPTQPVTCCNPLMAGVNVKNLTDFLSFHNYDSAEAVESEIVNLYSWGRPIMCTEWMHRDNDNLPSTILPIFQKYEIGCYNWGLVAGRTHTFMKWESQPGDPIPEIWQHDLYDKNYVPHIAEEIPLFQNYSYGHEMSSLFSKLWSKDRSNDWYAQQPWLTGCNFVPSTAVNMIEMWNADTYDHAAIDRELGLASGIGFNTVRVFLPYLVWKEDAAGLKERINDFLDVCQKYQIKMMPVMFDDCFIQHPQPGKQPEPIPGVHNSQWVSCPGVESKVAENWPNLEKYIKDIISTYQDDERVIIWDLYNEPQDRSLPLVKAAFKWAREVNPSQPLTCGVYHVTYEDNVSHFNIALSDVLSFHTYDAFKESREKVLFLESYGRPVLCTEYMARGCENTFQSHMPLFKEHKVGAINWGLVNGRIQTHMPWGSPEGATEPEVWFHDIFRNDGTPYRAEEVKFIQNITKN